jgi:ABC-type lipoprotein release transport system permease subunit
MMTISLAWKNIWRNRSRSMALLMAIGLGVAAGLILMGLVKGMLIQRFDSLIENQFSHIQIHAPEFLAEQESALTLPAVEKWREGVESVPQLKAYAFRTLTQAMLASGYTAQGVQVIGINPDSEKHMNRFYENLTEGQYLPEDIRNPIMISERMARKLRVQLGGRLVLTFQNLSGDITSAAFRVAGVFRTSNAGYDDMHVMVRAEDMQSLLSDVPVWHQMAILLHDHQDAKEVAKMLEEKYPHLDIRSWSQLSPELTILMEQGNFFSYIFMVIILLGLAFGILNTMLMAVFERMQELGMLMAIGMNKTKIALMIILETIYISFVGGLVGLGIGLGFMGMFGEKGLDLQGLSDALAEFGYDSVIYPQIALAEIITVLILVFLTALASSIGPALRAIKLNPAEAVRKI